jgi:hypothetical protein
MLRSKNRRARSRRENLPTKRIKNPLDSLLSKQVSLLGKFLDSGPDTDEEEQSMRAASCGIREA